MGGSHNVCIQDAGYEKTKVSYEKTLQNLQTDYLDLYLIHMPYGDYYGSWKAMEELYEEGKIKAIGVCNFETDRLVDLILNNNIVPAINQIELHSFHQQTQLREIMKKYEICPMAWAPFAEGMCHIFTNQILQNIGKKYDKTPAQVILRWLLQEHIIAIPKSAHKERIQENFNVENFMLEKEDIAEIEKMDNTHSPILKIRNLEEVYRLYNIRFKQ